jgi:small subunit ribosomal protein S9
MAITQYYATGRRKSSVARVYLRPGKGNIIVNRTPFEDYFNRDSVKQVLKQPLALTSTLEDYDILVNVKGGGKTGQAGAVRLGIARALCEANPENRAVLKGNGLLTRDARKVERKKYGQPGARKKFQFSKR